MSPLPLLLLFLPLLPASTAIGVNYGRSASNLSSPSAVAAFLRRRTLIDKVKLSDADPDTIRAFAHTGITLVVSVPNEDLPSIAGAGAAHRHPSPAADDWVAAHISPFYPATNITLIAAGNEVLTTKNPHLIAAAVPAMRALAAALSAAGHHAIRVTTPHSMSILSVSEPPSKGQFRPGIDAALVAPMLHFHRRTRSPFMVNAFPFYALHGPRRLKYALFRPNRGLYDVATGGNYTNLLAVQLDAVYSAMVRMGFGDVEVVVGATGWPSAGEAGQMGVGAGEAAEYNRNLVRMVEDGEGTPLMPNRRFEVYVFELFDEDLKVDGKAVERHFGLFRPDFSPEYDVGLIRSSKVRF